MNINMSLDSVPVDSIPPEIGVVAGVILFVVWLAIKAVQASKKS